jgi:hypothetical protein
MDLERAKVWAGWCDKLSAQSGSKTTTTVEPVNPLPLREILAGRHMQRLDKRATLG